MASNRRKAYSLHQSPLYRLSSKRKLAELGITAPKLIKLRQSEGLYTEWDEVNEKGKKRHIENPCPWLKRVQARIADLLNRIAPPKFLFCPAKGRSYISNASQHAHSASVRILDIKDYFPSTPSRRVYWFFHTRMECAPDIAGILTALSTFKGHLPTGSPLSPILSYYAYEDMWCAIDTIVCNAGCMLTVYVDDITISGPKVPEQLVWKVKKLIHRYDLRYHKERRYEAAIREVTGVIIRDGKLKLPNRQLLKSYELRQKIQEEADAGQQEILHRKLQGHQSQARQIAVESRRYPEVGSSSVGDLPRAETP